MSDPLIHDVSSFIEDFRDYQTWMSTCKTLYYALYKRPTIATLRIADSTNKTFWEKLAEFKLHHLILRAEFFIEKKYSMGPTKFITATIDFQQFYNLLALRVIHKGAKSHLNILPPITTQFLSLSGVKLDKKFCLSSIKVFESDDNKYIYSIETLPVSLFILNYNFNFIIRPLRPLQHQFIIIRYTQYLTINYILKDEVSFVEIIYNHFLDKRNEIFNYQLSDAFIHNDVKVDVIISNSSNSVLETLQESLQKMEDKVTYVEYDQTNNIIKKIKIKCGYGEISHLIHILSDDYYEYIKAIQTPNTLNEIRKSVGDLVDIYQIMRE